MTELRDQVEREATAARQSVGALTDEGVAHALELAAALIAERHDAIADANAADVAAAELDEGALDRLRLDDSRIAGSASSSRNSPRCRRSSGRTRAGSSTTVCRCRCAGSRSVRSARTSRRARTSPSTSQGSS